MYLDKEVFDLIAKEETRQKEQLEMIPSENYVSPAVREATGSVLTNKYAEGYPQKRYYSGNMVIDSLETLAIERGKKLFGAEHINVQPYSGSNPNFAVYLAACELGDTILAMELTHGGHLTHGSSVNLSGKMFKFVHYGVDLATGLIDYESVYRIAKEHKPKLIVAGGSAYPRIIDFGRFREIADEVGAKLLVDMAHFAGLVVGKVYPDPVVVADFVTSSTHKTLRGPRGGLIICKSAYAKDVDRWVFPGLQGGPLEHVIAAKAVCFGEAMHPDFKSYAEQIVRNAKVLAETLSKGGLKLSSGGTDSHLILIDFGRDGLTGKEASDALEKVGIIVNKNTVPGETRSPFITSGIRLGTPALTTRGMTEKEMVLIGNWIVEVLAAHLDETVLTKVGKAVKELSTKFMVP
ncbi:MAG: serine hydroxymethyltransferase [Candidatus Woykebacteria bacterium RIFCSPHIGHO2_01_FULL_43_29]|uniref:Serine hydroxymethyltransferase n=2 Tax=Candidatus Woykeibacteriota TaxID=1817899 RepID=A0A1G1WUJ1_9BACT|nr:MAG: serine hydroxymethyltransferase [Candidatus Woykebacteria bacterium RIFCSPHIGHO2_01_FULL_43_29]OGY29560.1 MAG: serine hydroxymethyltransferase [Candidatus Woykebacteria bacterium RIFCSPHIGHO2_02_FULL_43_16b]OGY31429.1 MAG: serine hydroxymethyltransferase [Candidatus Woykebacteria bacterium RIFCSPLOWO2_01_FULL_43_14]